MPFDASGNYTRVYNWTNDRDAGIKIQAARMDGEADDVVLALNQVFLRSGVVSMGGNLNLGVNRIIGLNSGTEGSPAIQFNADTRTGIYLNGTNRLGFATNGITRLEVTNAGIETSGNINLNSSSPRVNFTDTDTGAISRVNADSSSGNLSFEVDLNNTVAGSAMTFRVDGSERARIDANGNLGVGITNPSQRLHVAGSVVVTGGLTLGTALSVANGGTGATTAADARTNLDVPSRTGVGASGVWGINITGSAGSATTATTATNALSLGGVAASGYAQLSGANFTGSISAARYVSTTLPSCYIDLEDHGSGHPGFHFDGNDFMDYIRASNIWRVVIGGFVGLSVNSSTNVGIGTDSPRAQLHVRSSNTLNAPTLGSASGAAMYVTNPESNYGLVGGVAAGDGHVWLQSQATNGAVQAYNITLNEGGGNVAIGQSTAPERFNVNGNVRLTGVNPSYQFGTTANMVYSGEASTVQIAAGGSERFRANTSGILVTGNINATGDIGGFSDIALKENVQTIEKALDKVLHMRGVTFTRKSDGAARTGVVAQEMLCVMPEVVNTGEEYLSVSYGNLVGVLIEAIKELNAKIESKLT